MEEDRLMASVRKRRFEDRPREYRSPNFITLPPPSELLLAKSLADLAEISVRNAVFKKQIVRAAHTIRDLLMKYPKELRGKFQKPLGEMRIAVKNLPLEDVDPEYFSIIEEQTMAKFESLQSRIANVLAWTIDHQRTQPTQGTADFRIIADTEKNILSILLNDRTTDLQHLFWTSIQLRETLENSLNNIDQAPLPKVMKTAIRKAFKQVIYCFSLEASVPYKMRNDINTFLELLERQSPLTVEFATSLKILQAKAANCLKDSEEHHRAQTKALLFVYDAFESLDRVLAETTRCYWMMDSPDTFVHRRMKLVTEMLMYMEDLKKKFNIKPQKVRPGCLCYRQVQFKKGPRVIPISPELLSYAEEFRKTMGVPPFREDGKCYCPWIYQRPKTLKLEGIDELFRLYVTSIMKRAKANDIVKDTTTCFCSWMKMQRIFAGLKKDSCF